MSAVAKSFQPKECQPMTQACGCHVKMSDDERTTTYKSIGVDIKAPVCIEYCPLHAAAPELLEALHRAEPWLGKLIADGGHLKAVSPKAAEEALILVSQAIATAEER